MTGFSFTPRCTAMLGVLLIACVGVSARAAPIVGNVDEITGSVANGWSCIRGFDQPDSVALYAGIHRIGIVPNGVDRLDTSAVCGAGIILNGFQIELTPYVLQQFYGQTNLSFYGINPAAAAMRLRPSGPLAADPYFFPSGLITSLSADGAVSGLISNVPGGNIRGMVGIVTGGPLLSGGMLLGNATLQPNVQAPQSFSFTSPELAAALAASPPGYALPVYAYFSRNAGPAIQLGSPAMLAAAYLPFPFQVAQSRNQNGVTSTLFTKWIPAGQSLRGLSGSITFSGTAPGFSQAVVTIGETAESQPACRLDNGSSPSGLSPVSRLAAFTLMGSDSNPDTIPVDLALPYALPPAGPSGTCLAGLISAGYAFPAAGAAQYTTTTANVAAILSPAAAESPVVFAGGVGGGFRFSSGTQPNLYTIAALRMKAGAQLDSIAVSVSAAGVVGAPPSSGWLPNPIGSWTATTSFYAYTAEACESLGLSFADANAYYAVGVRRSPANYSVSAGAALLFSAPLDGNGALATQQSIFQTFPDAVQPGGSRVVLGAGDCLVALHNVSAPGDMLYGNLDFEDESTAYFHLVGN